MWTDKSWWSTDIASWNNSQFRQRNQTFESLVYLTCTSQEIFAYCFIRKASDFGIETIWLMMLSYYNLCNNLFLIRERQSWTFFAFKKNRCQNQQIVSGRGWTSEAMNCKLNNLQNVRNTKNISVVRIDLCLFGVSGNKQNYVGQRFGLGLQQVEQGLQRWQQ